MAFNFDSGQFNKESTPIRMGNWEVPRWAPTRARPLEMRPDPKPICDINGHFLPGAPRGSSRCFGHYVGTWDLPRKITREVAQQLAKEPPANRFSDWLHPRVQRPKITSGRMRDKKRGKTSPQKAISQQTFVLDILQHPSDDKLEWDARAETTATAVCGPLTGYTPKLIPKRDYETGVTVESGETGTTMTTDCANIISLRTTRKKENAHFWAHLRAHKNLRDKGETNISNLDINNDKEDVKEETRVNDILDWNKQKDPVDADGNGPYVPGSLTDPDKRHESYDLLVKKAVEEVHGPQEDETDKFWRKVAENAKDNEQREDDGDMKYDKKKKQPLKLPSVNVSQNFQFARNMHVGNLEHQPLPDTLGYRNLTKIAEHRDSDIIVKPYAIGWKGYGASGPTCCTKMRVHRPKTCDAKKSECEGIENKQRPSTSAPEFGRTFSKPITYMDLAIGWDYRPDDPKQEPKPPKHIDGSNGSKAPAVFTMVHTPKEEPDDCTKAGHSNPIFNRNRPGDDLGYHPVPYFEKDMTKEKRKDSCDVQYCSQHNKKADNTRSNSSNNSRKNSNGVTECDGIHGCGTPSDSSRKSSHSNSRPAKLENIKQAWTSADKQHGNKKCNSIESYDKTQLAQGKLQQSSPNASQISRSSTKDSLLSNNNNKHKYCISCNGTSKPITEEKAKDNFKSAFKAGNPNSVQSTSQDSKNLKIPKMRPPYSKKSYSIPTLAPPFSIWRDSNANGYPEHWRLASVYQHAYKPPEQRRKTLISSVYQ